MQSKIWKFSPCHYQLLVLVTQSLISCFIDVLFSPAKLWYSTKHRQSCTKPPTPSQAVSHLFKYQK